MQIHKQIHQMAVSCQVEWSQAMGSSITKYMLDEYINEYI